MIEQQDDIDEVELVKRHQNETQTLIQYRDKKNNGENIDKKQIDAYHCHNNNANFQQNSQVLFDLIIQIPHLNSFY